MNHYYTAPYPTPAKKAEGEKKNAYRSNFAVDKRSANGTKIQTIPFHTENLANEFLSTVNVYVNGTLCYSGK